MKEKKSKLGKEKNLNREKEQKRWWHEEKNKELKSTLNIKETKGINIFKRKKCDCKLHGY